MNPYSIEQLMKSDGEFVSKKLEKWAELIPDKTFFFYGEEDKSLSFKEFNRLSNCIAHHLNALGINKGDRVLVFLKNPLASTLCMFGIWKAGAVFCPINSSYMGRLLSYQINDTGSQYLITEKDLIPSLNDVKREINNMTVVVYAPKETEHDYHPQTAGNRLDAAFQEITFDSFLSGDGSNPDPDLSFKDVASIIYTSGTTGPAKGVVHTHRYVNAYTFTWRSLTHQEDVIYSDLPMYHIAAAFQNVCRAAWVGCTVAVWDKFSPVDFWERIRISGSTNAVLLDVMIPWLLNPPQTPEDRMNTLNKVYMQPMPLHHHEIARRFGFDYVVTGYGQTEAGSGFAGFFDEIPEGEEGTPPALYKGYKKQEMYEICRKINTPMVSGSNDFKKGFMGKPPFYLQAIILNDDDELCAPGEVGQICFRSALPYAIIHEYFGKAEATIQAFRNYWFHSGDSGFQDEEGFFYFMDRTSGRIRRRGENISSYQIEDVVNKHTAVNCCAAFPIPAAEGEEDDIVVCVVVQAGAELEEQTFRQWLQGEMPKFMWPQHVKFVDDLPRTPTTKVEKYKLREIILSELDRSC